jgi:multiple antibiotic resistance protein
MSAGEIASVASVLFAILNPLTKLPLWIEFVNKYPERLHRKMALVTTASSLTAILVVLWFGVSVLEFLEVTVEGIQVAGGSVIVLIGFSMVVGQREQPEEAQSTELVEQDSPDDTSWVTASVVPMAIPIVVGGGVIAVVATVGAQFQDAGDRLTISLIAIGLALLTYLVYSYAPALARFLGPSGLEIMTRIFGIILLALGYQITFGGLVEFFPGLAA